MACQLGLSLYLAGQLGESHAAYFENPLDMSRLCSATICKDDTLKLTTGGDTMIVGNRVDKQG